MKTTSNGLSGAIVRFKVIRSTRLGAYSRWLSESTTNYRERVNTGEAYDYASGSRDELVPVCPH